MAPRHTAPAAPSHAHLDCPACGDRLYFGTDPIGRTLVLCYTCRTESALPTIRDPEPPRARRPLNNGVTGPRNPPTRG